MFERLEKLDQVKALNKGSYSEYDASNREFVVFVKNQNFKVPDDCVSLKGYIYDNQLEDKICRICVQNE